MDTLSRYIHEAKKLTAFKLFSVYFLLAALISGLAGFRLNHALNAAEFQNFLSEIPVFQLEDGQVIAPKDTVWEKKLSENQFLFKIDTTRDTMDNPPENGLMVMRRGIIFALNGQVKQYAIPAEKIVVDTPFLKNLFRMVMINTCIVIGVILLIIFLLGQASTSVLSSLFLWLFKKEALKDQIRRSSFIGWFATLILNMALILSGHGFSLLTCVFIATALSVLGLSWPHKN